MFDKREAISAGDKNGDGGVVKKDKKVKGKKKTPEDLPAKCCVCEKKWDRYIGKKKCYTCGVPGKSIVLHYATICIVQLCFRTTFLRYRYV